MEASDRLETEVYDSLIIELTNQLRSAKTTEFVSDPSNCFSEKHAGILKQETMF